MLGHGQAAPVSGAVKSVPSSRYELSVVFEPSEVERARAGAFAQHGRFHLILTQKIHEDGQVSAEFYAATREDALLDLTTIETELRAIMTRMNELVVLPQRQRVDEITAQLETVGETLRTTETERALLLKEIEELRQKRDRLAARK